jgi:hypothetical protein
MRNSFIRKMGFFVVTIVAGTSLNPAPAAAQGILDRLKQAARDAQQKKQQEQPQAQQQGQQQGAPRPATTQDPATAAGAPPQAAPAADIGTPEATAKIAADAGYLDVLGIKLGMPVKEALDVLKTDNPQFSKVDLQYLHRDGNANNHDPNNEWLVRINAVKDSGGNYGDTLFIKLTLPPNPQLVYRVTRQVSFPPDARPALETLLAGLRQKYGPESLLENPANFLWYFNAEQQLMKDDMLLPLRVPFNSKGGIVRTSAQQIGCSSLYLTGGEVSDFALYWREWTNKRESIKKEQQRDSFPWQLACEQVTMVGAVVGARNGLVERLDVGIENRLLEFSANEATDVWMKQATEDELRKKHDEGLNRGVPKL